MGLKEGISSRIAALSLGYEMVGDERKFYGFAPITEATEEDIVWAKNDEIIKETKAQIIVCRKPIDENKTFILTENPRLAYIRMLKLYTEPIGITGNYIVGSNCNIAPGVIIYDNVRIGNNCIIHPGCVIGSEGFGFEWDGQIFHKFPHIGGVKIGNDVEIQAMTNIDRGALGDTIIGDGTKIDTHVHVGHNTKIGNNCQLCAKVQTGGSNIIGDRVFLGPNTVIRTIGFSWTGGYNRKFGCITIGDDAFTGVGSLIVKKVKSGERVMGHPAKPF